MFAWTYSVSDSNTDNMDICCPIQMNLCRQPIDLTRWNAISNENGHVRYIGSIAVSTVEYLCPQRTKPTSRVCVTAVVFYGTDGSSERRLVCVVGQIELNLRVISLSNQNNDKVRLENQLRNAAKCLACSTTLGGQARIVKSHLAYSRTPTKCKCGDVCSTD
jgi:hypothetical protein